MYSLICKKIGMISYFTESGDAIPATLLSFDNVGVTYSESLGKNFVVMFKQNKPKKHKNVIKQIGMLNDLALEFFKSIDNQEASDFESLISKFNVGDNIKVNGVTKSKGFQGVVKRWGFAGGPRTHGQSDRQRAPGSIGARTIPGRVFKGKRMAGRMGGANKTVTGLKILSVDLENKLLLVSGSVPGSKSSIVIVNK